MKEREINGEARVLCWPGRLLSEDDLRRHLTCQSEILLTTKTVVTPLAMDHLRGKGVRIRREDADTATRSGIVGGRGAWAYADESADPLVRTALAALAREGVSLVALPGTTASQWAKAIALGTSAGGLVFCGDPALVCCIANKVAGVRAAAVIDVMQAKRAKQTLAVNLLAIEAPGRTLHELRQIVRIAVGAAGCPPEIAKVLQELDGHAHR